MSYKIKGAMKKSKKSFILFTILWIVLAIVFVSPFTYSTHIAQKSGTLDLQIFIETYGMSITNPIGTIVNIFSEGIQDNYFSVLLIVSIIYSVFFFVGFIRAIPKNEYTDIEHGSSDWSQNGEQYEILNKNKGIILAENNYLPVDKRGNVNVLVVGRIRFW